MAAILDFRPSKVMPALLRGTPPLIFLFICQRPQTAEKPSFTLNGHGFTPNDPTIYLVSQLSVCNWIIDCDRKSYRPSNFQYKIYSFYVIWPAKHDSSTYFWQKKSFLKILMLLRDDSFYLADEKLSAIVVCLQFWLADSTIVSGLFLVLIWLIISPNFILNVVFH